MIHRSGGGFGKVLALGALVLLATCGPQRPDGSQAQHHRFAEGPLVGPPNGAVMVAGGGELGAEIWERFVELAGGDEARIVVIPTAGTEDSFPADWYVLEALRAAGGEEITVLHTRDREEADSEEFVRPLLEATGVWIPGGRQWRLVDAYLHTRTHEALRQVLARGGVVAGTSAGASIQASFLVRGDPETNQTVMTPEYDEGFGFLQGAAVDQHLLARNRENDLWEVLASYPDHIGIGIDEGTAVVVQGDQAEVIGRSQVFIYDFGLDFERPQTRTLRAGDRFDLGVRQRIPTRVEDAELGEEGHDGVDRLLEGDELLEGGPLPEEGRPEERGRRPERERAPGFIPVTIPA